jgi:hypothetical protein
MVAFTDQLLTDPYAALSEGAVLAYRIGPSGVVGGTRTDMAAWASNDVFMQIWIGVDDQLPRRIRAIYRADPRGLRHDLELSNWQLDGAVAAESFGTQKAKAGQPMNFAVPGPGWPVDAKGRPIKPAACASAKRFGGSTAHSAYGGTEHTNLYGGTNAGAAGYGACHTYPSGGTCYHPPAYPVQHPPVAVPYYSTGCYGRAAAAGAVVGMAAGAAAPVPGSTTTTVTTTTSRCAMGATHAALPTGSMSVGKNGQTCYLNGNTWLLPAFGADGVHCTVVAAP